MPLKRDRRRARAALQNAAVMAGERERQRHEVIGAQVERESERERAAVLAQEWIWPIMMAFLWDNVAIVALSYEAEVALVTEMLHPRSRDARDSDQT